MENQETYQKARKRIEAKIGFYIHLAVYVGVNILLIIINRHHGRRWDRRYFERKPSFPGSEAYRREKLSLQTAGAQDQDLILLSLGASRRRNQIYPRAAPAKEPTLSVSFALPPRGRRKGSST